MCIVWHQAICPYFNVQVRTPRGHQVYVCLIIFIAEECLQTPIPSLSNMMWYFWNYHTSNPGHGHVLTILKTKSITKYGVPRISRTGVIHDFYHTCSSLPTQLHECCHHRRIGIGGEFRLLIPGNVGFNNYPVAFGNKFIHTAQGIQGAPYHLFYDCGFIEGIRNISVSDNQSRP